MSKIPLTAVREYYTPELTKFLQDLGKIAAGINIVEMVTPVNAKACREKWMELARHGRWTNPSFKYDLDLLAKVAGLGSQLDDVLEGSDKVFATLSQDGGGEALRWMTSDRIEELEREIAIAEMVTNLTSDSWVSEMVRPLLPELVTDIYGAPTTETVQEAYAYAKVLADGGGHDLADDDRRKEVRRKLNAVELTAEGIREGFLWVARECGFAETRPVEISDTATAIDVRDASSKGAVVVIPRDRKISGTKLIQLCGHEILCHWQDSERAAKVLPLLGSGALKPAGERLYEGHAVFSDYHVRLLLGEKAQRQQLPFYILAIEAAKAGRSFGAVANELYRYIRPTKTTDEEALAATWNTCFRVFRGSAGDQDNSKLRYAFTKDAAYFEGRMLAEELHEQDLDSILQIATLSVDDVDILGEVVEFEHGVDDLAQLELMIQRLIQFMLGGEVAL